MKPAPRRRTPPPPPLPFPQADLSVLFAWIDGPDDDDAHRRPDVGTPPAAGTPLH